MSHYERIMNDFNKHKKRIITFLIENDRITNKVSVEMTKLSSSYLRRILRSLLEVVVAVESIH